MIITDQKVYSGDFLHQRFAYKYFRDDINPIGNIVAFRAPAKVEADGMIDLEDILSKDYIYSDDMIHFCWELPILNSSFGAVAFQRLFNTQIANILYSFINKQIEVDGDDLMIREEFLNRGVHILKGKCSVSITYIHDNAAMGHTGLNIRPGDKAPIHAVGTNLSDIDAEKFMKYVVDMFYSLTHDLFVSSVKVY
jgi:hypothetical protein